MNKLFTEEFDRAIRYGQQTQRDLGILAAGVPQAVFPERDGLDRWRAICHVNGMSITRSQCPAIWQWIKEVGFREHAKPFVRGWSA